MYAIYSKEEVSDMMCDVFNYPIQSRLIVELNTKYTELDYYMFDKSDENGNLLNGIKITANYEPLLFIEDADFDKAVDYVMVLVKLHIVKCIYTESSN